MIFLELKNRLQDIADEDNVLGLVKEKYAFEF
jgi:hypothetical protein